MDFRGNKSKPNMKKIRKQIDFMEKRKTNEIGISVLSQ